MGKIIYTKIQDQKEMVSFELKRIKRKPFNPNSMPSMVKHKYKYYADILVNGKIKNRNMGIYADDITEAMKKAIESFLF